MFRWDIYGIGYATLLGAALLTWVIATARRNVTMVDSMWPIFFLLSALTYAGATSNVSPRAELVVLLTAAWALRLCSYLTWRNWGEPEDRRYQAIRRHNEPHFEWKSLYLIFGLQATLAWIISLPLLGAILGQAAWSLWDALGTVLFCVGLAFETVADWQLARFKRDPANRGQVMDQGLWAYSRHPNYFGDCCVWWGLYLIAVGAGAWWAVVGPLLMTFLLLRVSGVALLEKNIGKRRPAYEAYTAHTNAFIPGPKREARAHRTTIRGNS